MRQHDRWAVSTTTSDMIDAWADRLAALDAVVNLEQFRRPVEFYRAMMECGEIATEMPMKFRATADEYRARVIHADMLLSQINGHLRPITTNQDREDD